MNLELLESFGQNYPEEADGTLDCISMALTCTFNRWGTLLAVGCNDGRIVIWDFLTRGIAKILSAHIHPVCSLCWSRDGHKLVSASTDNIVMCWLMPLTVSHRESTLTCRTFHIGCALK
ncbi:retinoblastoma-binding protein 5-like [Pyxicephalus adspersus]|uniref:retinoblastoma-binding protein 5-like n=1 Tax=Pyxicephalus adspersus TaxID=30357 RepID=UPI003B5C16C0